jgi:hypothetical protein
MIRIRYSPEPFHELELEGTNAELADLRDSIRRFAGGSEIEFSVAAESEYNPSRYERVLRGLLIRRDTGRIVIRVENDILVISGRPNGLCLFADNLPYDAQHTSAVNYHVHFDAAGREDHVSEESLDILLSLKR